MNLDAAELDKIEQSIKCDWCGTPGTSHYDAEHKQFVCAADRQLVQLLEDGKQRDRDAGLTPDDE